MPAAVTPENPYYPTPRPSYVHGGDGRIRVAVMILATARPSHAIISIRERIAQHLLDGERRGPRQIEQPGWTRVLRARTM
jgi:hypothetical protein